MNLDHYEKIYKEGYKVGFNSEEGFLIEPPEHYTELEADIYMIGVKAALKEWSL